MKNIIVFLMFLFIMSCFQEKKVSNSNKSIREKEIDSLVVYNDILNDLIENHIYYKYLGKEWEAHYIALHKKKIDSITYRKKIDDLKNSILQNDSLRGTLYFSDIFDGYKRDIKFLKLHEGVDVDEIKIQIGKKNYLPIDSLKSNFVKLKSLSNKIKDTSKVFEIGVLGLSKFTLNKDKTLGMLYFEFICGAKCGEGAIILINKANNKWHIVKKYTLWEI